MKSLIYPWIWVLSINITFKCSFLSSSVKSEWTVYVPLASAPCGISSSGVVNEWVVSLGGYDPTMCVKVSEMRENNSQRYSYLSNKYNNIISATRFSNFINYLPLMAKRLVFWMYFRPVTISRCTMNSILVRSLIPSFKVNFWNL